MKDFDLEDLKARINPQYSNTIGTESYERRLCAEEIESLRARVAELEAMDEPIGFYYPEDIIENTRVFKCATTNNDYGTMQPLFRTTPTVAAALRKAAEVCDTWANDLHDDRDVDDVILAIPHDDSALRELCNEIAAQAYSLGFNAIPSDRHHLEEVVDRVLTEKD